MWSSEPFETVETTPRQRNAGVWRLDELELPLDELPMPPAFTEDGMSLPGAESRQARRDSQESDHRLTFAFERGREEGIAVATNAERSRIQPAITALESAVARFNADRARWRSNAAGYLAAMAAAMARHLIECEISVDHARMKRLAERAVEQFPADEPVRVRLNPQDLAMIGEGAAAIGQRRDVQWMPDAAVGRGGCMVEGRVHVIDARVDTALERMYRHIVASDA